MIKISGYMPSVTSYENYTVLPEGTSHYVIFSAMSVDLLHIRDDDCFVMFRCVVVFDKGAGSILIVYTQFFYKKPAIRNLA